MKEDRRRCELCGGDAAVYCGADGAFLCWTCDARVHGANFLVARHLRSLACAACGSLDDAPRVSGAAAARLVSLCPSCSDSSPMATSPSSSSSSSCISSAESFAAAPGKSYAIRCRSRSKRGSAAAIRFSPTTCRRKEAAMERWGRRMGLRSTGRCAAVAVRMLSACGREMAGLPPKAELAGALWFAIKLCGGCTGEGKGGGTCEEALKSLEACSRVPARVIVVAESRIARAARARGGAAEAAVVVVEEEEGWADSGE